MTERVRHHEKFWQLTAYSLLGPLLWAAHLGILYGVHHVACVASRNAAEVWAWVATGAATTLFVAALIVQIVWPAAVLRAFGAPIEETDLGVFLMPVARWLSALSIFGVVAAAGAVVVLPVCHELR